MLSKAELLGIIDGIEDNQDNLRRLVGQVQSSIGIMPFVGAGLSVPYGFPGWGAFLVKEGRKAGIDEKIRRHLDAGEYEEAAEDLQRARGNRAFQDAIDNNYGLHKLTDVDIKGAVTLIPRIADGPVVTTNFDHLLEHVFELAGCPFEHVIWGVKVDLATEALNLNQRVLLKIHGDVKDRTERILTRDDYRRHYGSVDVSGVDFTLPLPRLLRRMIMSRPLLFVGCGLKRDRVIGVLSEISRNESPMVHYAIVEQPSSSRELYERSRFLSDCCIRPIWYPEGRHDLIESLLFCLISEGKSPRISATATTVQTAKAMDPMAEETSKRLYEEGLELFYSEEYARCLVKFSEAVKLDPQNANAWYWKGLMLESLHDNVNALECFGRVCELGPCDAATWNGIGNCMMELGHFSQARAALTKALDMYETKLGSEISESARKVLRTNIRNVRERLQDCPGL